MSLMDWAKEAKKVFEEAGKIDLYLKILGLIEDLSVKREEIEALKDENKLLKEKLKITEEYYFKNNSYWHKETNDGPFCSRCFDKNKELIRAISTTVRSHYAKCPECENTVNFTGKEPNYDRY